MRTVVIIPTYNEKENIVLLLKRILQIEPDINILNIDDNSPDGTGRIVEQIFKDYDNVRVHHRPKKEGIGSAYITGFRYALKQDFDYILTMDADFSHSPQVLPNLIQEAKNCDLVLGSRYVEGGKVTNWGVFRRYLSKSANLFVERMLNLEIKDYTTGFRCYGSNILRKVKLDEILSNGYAFQIEMVYRIYCVGGKIKEYPIEFIERKCGKSKISTIEIVKALGTVFNLVIDRMKRRHSNSKGSGLHT